MRARLWAPLLTVAFFASYLLSLSVGAAPGVGPLEALEFMFGLSSGISRDLEVYRLSRAVASTVLGSGLAASGMGLQYVLRNPLADPYLAGIASGALLGVTLELLRGPHGFLALYLAALGGGLLTLLAVISISSFAGFSSLSLLVAGITISYVLSGATMIVMIELGPKIPGALYWLFGSVAFVTWPIVLRSGVAVAASVIGLVLLARRIDTLLLGDEVATSLGVRVPLVRALTFVLASAATAAVVAMAGPVGFIGLVSPWAARRLTGSSFRKALPIAIVLGSELAIVSDVIARIIIAPSEAPLTAVTSIFGAPVLALILVRSRAETSW